MSGRLVALSILLMCSVGAFAGGPLVVGGPAAGNRPAFGVDGQPFRWNPAQMPIRYRVDPGPMTITTKGAVVIDNAAGVQRVQSMFSTWQSVGTTALAFANSGNILPTGAYTGGDVQTLAQYNAIVGSCKSATQNPVVFDSNGSLIAALGLPPEVIGFSSPCAVDAANGFITGAQIVMNGSFQDTVEANLLTTNEFDEAITHEIGHFIGLDHSQINVEVLAGAFPCDVELLGGLPLMFPFAACQARKDAGLPALSTDDIAWVSKLYPNSAEETAYGTISGLIVFGDGETPAQGFNVIARIVDDQHTIEDESRRFAVSAVSGYLFTGNPGQSITAVLGAAEDNTNGSPLGSRKPSLIGYYELIVPPGTYTVEVEAVSHFFTGGSSVGPLDPPVSTLPRAEFWNVDESPFDFPGQRDTITVRPGDKITNIDIILNQTNDKYDDNEDGGAQLQAPVAMSDAEVCA